MGSRWYVYRNLHKKCWSLKKDGKVIGHYQWFMFDGGPTADYSYAGFKVSESGRQRVIREQRKNVHAFAWGYYPEFDEENIKAQMDFDKEKLIKVTYNPYKYGCFTQSGTNIAVGYGQTIYFTPDGLFVVRPRV